MNERADLCCEQRHQWDVPKPQIKLILRLLYVNRIFYSPTILAAKLTILLQLIRLFERTKSILVFRLFKTLIWLNVLFYAANILTVIWQCTPIHKAWDGSSIPGTCINTNLNFMITGSINVLSDLLILILPLWVVWHLRMPIQMKTNISTIFAVGVAANVAGIMRLYYSVHLIKSSDLTFVRLQHGMWRYAAPAPVDTVFLCY